VNTVTGSDLLIGCAKRRVVLEDVIPDGSRVRLLGIADRRHIGARVEIRFQASGKVVARPTVGANGRFVATAPIPPVDIRSSNRARYVASIGRDRSTALKLMRRMQVADVRAAGGKVVIKGWITGPLAPRESDRVIEVRRHTCTKTESVARIQPDADGRFRATVNAPRDVGGAVYRLKTKVPYRSREGSKLFRTITLPRAVDF